MKLVLYLFLWSHKIHSGFNYEKKLEQHTFGKISGLQVV